jgi:hypothetical protein
VLNLEGRRLNRAVRTNEARDLPPDDRGKTCIRMFPQVRIDDESPVPATFLNTAMIRIGELKRRTALSAVGNG